MAHLRRVAVSIDLPKIYVHHQQIYAGIQRYAQERQDWECFPAQFMRMTRRTNLRSGGADGIIARVDQQLADSAKKAGIPLVNVWLNSPVAGLPAVLWDAEGAARMAAAHLASRGFQRFGFMGYEKDRGSGMLLKAFREELGTDCSTTWLSVTDHELDSQQKWDRFQRQLDRWIQTWSLPMAVFSHHDELSSLLFDACRRNKLSVPHEVALIGTSNEPVLVNSRYLSLSSIDYGFERIGYRAAELLDQLMDGGPAPAAPIVLRPTELVARQSSDVFCADHPDVAKALRFIAEKSHTGIGVDEVAEHIQTTVRTLSRLFERHTHQGVHATIVRMQVERAKRLLVGSDDSIKSIAKSCGFRDANHICAVFQRLEGLSPRKFRGGRSKAEWSPGRKGPR